MYDIAFSVLGCLRAGTRVDVAWLVDSEGLDGAEPGAALALTAGGGRVGSVLGGAFDDRLADVAPQRSVPRLVTLTVGVTEALVAGLPADARARFVVTPAQALPTAFWDRVRDRRPAGLVLDLPVDGEPAVRFVDPDDAQSGLPAGGSSTQASGDRVVTVLRPVPALVLVGGGPVVAALQPAAALLGWQPRVFGNGGEAAAVIAGLSSLDKVVVVGHDPEVAGPALVGALASSVGYVGLVGGRRAVAACVAWLGYLGVTDLSGLHAPAGLDIGAGPPAEVALAVLAEAVAVAAGKDPSPAVPAARAATP
ncbi:MAG: XdhC family protein [Actinobacteria bacterium]|nr:XdhC family protein [Actinomycetota bacterium]